jgi:hypothetical protein
LARSPKDAPNPTQGMLSVVLIFFLTFWGQKFYLYYIPSATSI